MEAKIQQPQLYVDYPSPANFTPGDRELDVLANVLGNGKSSRLYKRLVYDLKIAQSVSASQQSQLLASTFEITASPMPGHTLDEILAVIDQEIAALQAKPVDAAELDRAKNQIESETVRSLEPLLARAERLQSYNYLLNDPGFVTEDLRRYRAVDAGAVQQHRAGGPQQGRARGGDDRAQPRRADHGTGEEMTSGSPSRSPLAGGLAARPAGAPARRPRAQAGDAAVRRLARRSSSSAAPAAESAPAVPARLTPGRAVPPAGARLPGPSRRFIRRTGSGSS